MMRKFLLALAFLGLWATTAQAQVTFHDSSVSSGTGTSLSHDQNVPAGSNNFAVLMVHMDSVPDPSPAIAVTCEGNAAVEIEEIGIIVGTGFRYVSAWYCLLGSTSGDITMSAASLPATAFNKVLVSYVLQGVDQSTPIDGLDTNETNGVQTDTLTITSATDDMVVSCISVDGGGSGAAIATVNLTRPTDGAGPGTGFAAATGYAAGVSTIGADWTWTASGNQAFSHIAFNVNAAVGGGPTAKPGGMLLGVGGV